MQVTFVILHYLTAEDTIECVESILGNINDGNYSIIIVDNASPNDSGNVLVLKYKDNDKVEVILSNQNLGFAKGNNLGFLQAKYQYDADFIILLNNDTIIKQKDFIYIVKDKYKRENFAVLGPNIISTVDGGYQNPCPVNFHTKRQAGVHVLRLAFLLVLSYIKLVDLYRKIKPVQNEGKHLKKEEDLNGVQLHGSCLIFSRSYIERFDGLFSKTFMYMEEDILYYLCSKNDLKTLYTPDLVIYHKEDSSTDALLGSNARKQRFVLRHSIKSCWHLFRLMDK